MKVGMEFAPRELVAERLVKGREERGVSQQDIATELHVSQPTVCSWENAGRMPERDRWTAIAKAYGFPSMEELFFVVPADQAAGG